jgi:hypothetical protein
MISEIFMRVYFSHTAAGFYNPPTTRTGTNFQRESVTWGKNTITNEIQTIDLPVTTRPDYFLSHKLPLSFPAFYAQPLARITADFLSFNPATPFTGCIKL